MCKLSEEKKNEIIQNEHRFDVRQLAKAILQYDNVCLEDFDKMDPYRKEQIASILSEYGIFDDEFEWQRIIRERYSENLLDILVQYISRGKCASHKYCHLEEAKEYFWHVLRSTIHGKKGNEKEKLLRRFVPLFSSWSNFPQVEEAIYKMRYYGDIFFSDDNLFIELFKFLLSLPKSDQKELQQEYIVQWGICAESIGRCWPCLPSHKLTIKEKNEIHLKRIGIAAHYLNYFPKSLFCESAYSIINDDLHYLDVRYIHSKDILRYLEPEAFGNSKLQSLFESFFSYKLRLSPQELFSYVRQDNFIEDELMQNNFVDLNGDYTPKTLILNIGKWGCGKTSLIMGLSNACVEGYNICWEKDFDVRAKKYLERGCYPLPSQNWYSIETVHIQKGRNKAHLQFVDGNFNVFCSQLLEERKGADFVLSQETKHILSRSDSIILNILVDITEPKYNSWKMPFNNNQEVILVGILHFLEWHNESNKSHFWKNVIKINIIIMKYDLTDNNCLVPKVLADNKNNYQFDTSRIDKCILDRFEDLWDTISRISKKWGIKSELLVYCIGKTILSDRYKFDNTYANAVMHSLIKDVSFSKKRWIPSWLNKISKI